MFDDAKVVFSQAYALWKIWEEVWDFLVYIIVSSLFKIESICKCIRHVDYILDSYSFL